MGRAANDGLAIWVRPDVPAPAFPTRGGEYDASSPAAFKQGAKYHGWCTKYMDVITENLARKLVDLM